jgi:hypothetical protein
MLEETGFVDIHSEELPLLMWKWAGKEGVENAITVMGVFRGIKTPVLNAGGYGMVSTESEYDILLEGMQKELDEIPGTKKEFFICWGRKPENR